MKTFMFAKPLDYNLPTAYVLNRYSLLAPRRLGQVPTGKLTNRIGTYQLARLFAGSHARDELLKELQVLQANNCTCDVRM